MSTFQRYFLQKLLVNLGAIIPVLLLIVVGRLFTNLLDRVVAKVAPPETLLYLLSIGALNSLVYLLPFGAMVAVMWALRQSYYDGEIHAAFSLRISRHQIHAVLLYFGVPLALLLFYLLAEIIPGFNHQYKLLKEQGRQDVGISMTSPGQFLDTANGGVVFFEQRDGNRVGGIFLADATGNAIETAAHGRQIKSPEGSTFELLNGQIYQQDTEGEHRTFSYRSHQVWIPEAKVDISIKPKMMDWMALLHRQDPQAIAELQRRLAIPVSLMLLLFLAELISRVPPGRSNYSRMISGIVIFLVYTNLISLSSKMVADGQLPVVPGVWSVPIALLFGMGAWVFYQRFSAR